MKKSNRKTKRATSAKKTAAATSAPTKGGIPLKTICASLGIETKPARVKLRRFWRREDAKGKREGNFDFHEKNDRWIFSPAEAKVAREVLAPK